MEKDFTDLKDWLKMREHELSAAMYDGEKFDQEKKYVAIALELLAEIERLRGREGAES